MAHIPCNSNCNNMYCNCKGTLKTFAFLPADFSLFFIMKPPWREKFSGYGLPYEEEEAFFYRNYSDNSLCREKNMAR